MKYWLISIFFIGVSVGVGADFYIKDSDKISSIESIQSQRRTETIIVESVIPEGSFSSFLLLGAQFDRYISKSLSVGGSVYGAVKGGDAGKIGGYAAGAFNVSAEYDLIPSLLAAEIKLLLGGSGGGGAPVQGGLFAQPIVSLILSMADMRFKAGIGQYISLDSDFRGNTFTVGLVLSQYHLYLPYNKN
jgi:hypothetical protein